MSGRAGRLRPRCRLVRRRARRVRHPVPAARRAVRPARGAARDHHRHVGDADRRHVRIARRPLPDHRVTGDCPSRCSRRCRSSSVGAARSAHRRSRHGSQRSSTLRSCRVEVLRHAARPRRLLRARRSTVTRRPMTFSAAVVLCCGSDDAEVERRAAAIGRDAAELRAERCRRHARRGRRDARPLARRRGGAHLPPGARPRRPRPPRPRRHRRRSPPRLTRRQPLEVCGRHVDRGTVKVSAANRRSGICGRHVDRGTVKVSATNVG